MSLVFIGTLRPFISIEASSTPNGSDLRGLAREEVIFPNTVVPAFRTTFPLTATFWASFASKLLPATVCELMRLTVLTVNVVPAGMVAAFEDATAKQTQQVPIDAMSLLYILLWGWFDLNESTINGLDATGEFRTAAHQLQS